MPNTHCIVPFAHQAKQRPAVDCLPIRRAVLVSPHTGPQEVPETTEVTCELFMQTPLPAIPPAHPTSTPALGCFLMQSEKCTKTIKPAEQRHEFGMSVPEFLAPERAFHPDKTVEIQIQVLSSEFPPLHAECTMPMHTPAPCTECFLLTVEISMQVLGPIFLHLHTEYPIPHTCTHTCPLYRREGVLFAF